MTKWEVRLGDRVISCGPAETFPAPWERRRFREDGYDIFVDGRLWLR